MKRRSVRMLHVEQGEEFQISNYERIVNMEPSIGGGVLVFIAQEDDAGGDA